MRLGGASEVARELGVSRQRLLQLRDRPGFPAPVGEIAAGIIWDLDQVAGWSASGLRRTPGRPVTRRHVLNERYLLDEEPVGSGGFADVYRAVDVTLPEAAVNSVVAIKVLRELTEVPTRRRFLRELRLIAACNHPNIVPVLDSGEDDTGRLWYAMPLAKGNLHELSDRLVGDTDRIVQIMRQICAGVEQAHALGIFHRDLKPANVLRFGTDTWAISDFGLAREAERLTTALTSTMQGVGTMFFAAPESWRGAKYAEAPADIYSLGRLLQNLVTGEVPFEVDPPEGPFRSVIRKAIRQSPSDRYVSVNDFLIAIETVIGAPHQWTSPEERALRLEDLLQGEHPDNAALAELIDLAAGPGGVLTARLLRTTIPRLSRSAIEGMWKLDREGFTTLLEAYSTLLVDGERFAFEFCDVIADFFDRVVSVTTSPDHLATAVRGLVALGHTHNRFRVQSTTVSILQRVRDAPHALAAAEALRQSRPESVVWTLSDFAARSFHPIIRDVVLEIRAQLRDGEVDTSIAGR